MEHNTKVMSMGCIAYRTVANAVCKPVLIIGFV